MEIHPKEAEIISFVLSRVKQLISIWLKEEIVEKLSGNGSHGSWWIHLQGRWIFTIYKTVRGSHLQTLPPFLRVYRWKGNAGSAERIPVSIGNKKKQSWCDVWRILPTSVNDELLFWCKGAVIEVEWWFGWTGSFQLIGQFHLQSGKVNKDQFMRSGSAASG